MQIKLQKLSIKNFKGIKNYELKIGGESVVIAGKNGSGKTTLADAWFWLWTDQDSIGSAKFNAIELDQNGIPINQQNAVVEAEIFIGSKVVRLKKEYYQKWTKKRGQAVSEMTGHTTDYYFDDIPMDTKSKYMQKINKILKSELFRPLSDVHEFCGRMKPDARRAILIDVAGSVSDAAICDQFAELKELGKLLQDKTPEELKKMLTSERKKCNEQLDRLPERIDELQKSAPDVGGKDEIVIINKLAQIEEQIIRYKNEILAIRSGLKISELKTELHEIKQQYVMDDDLLRPNREIIAKAENEIAVNNNVIVELTNNNKALEKEKSLLAERWKEINKKRFRQSPNCFACGQALPEEKMLTLENTFNADKAARIKEIDNLAAKIIQKIKKNEIEIDLYKDHIQASRELIKQNLKFIDEIAAETDVKNEVIAKRQAEIEEKIKSMESDIEPEIKAIETALSELEAQKGKLESIRLDFVQIEKIGRRVLERRADLNAAAARYEDIERRLNMLETFSRKKSEFIEESINANFQITQWKLFEQQINQGIREICEPMRDGVPYSSDLNYGSRINVGLDVIRTLQAHYDCYLPVFVDNAESITEWLDFDGQVIKLAAAPNIEKLEVING